MLKRSNVGSPRRASIHPCHGFPQLVSTWKPADCLTSCVRRCIITIQKKKSTGSVPCLVDKETRQLAPTDLLPPLLIPIENPPAKVGCTLHCYLLQCK